MLIMAMLACAPELSPEPVRDTGGDTGLAAGPPEETTDGEGLTVSTMQVDASDYKSWVYVDLDTGEVSADASSLLWDIAIQRYHFALSGGVMGAGSAGAVVLSEEGFDDVSSAPSDGYETDQPDADKDGVPEYVMGDWYDYDSSTHILTPAPVVYIIRTDLGYHRFEVLDYYNGAGTSGHPSFRWGAIPLIN